MNVGWLSVPAWLGVQLHMRAALLLYMLHVWLRWWAHGGGGGLMKMDSIVGAARCE